MKPQTTVNCVNSTMVSRLLVMAPSSHARTHKRVSGTMFPPVSKGGAAGAGSIRNDLSFSAVISFRQAPEADGRREDEGVRLQESTVYNLITLIYNAPGQ